MVKIKNPIQINDWSIEKLLHIVLVTQLSLWGSIGLDLIGIQVPLLRQVVSYISLTFIPGILILRVLKLHKLGTGETLLYATGLSLSTLMFTGFVINLIYPYFGILEPISLVPLLLTLTAITSILSFFAYLRDKEFSNPDLIDLNEISSPSFLLLFLIPFLSIFGTYLVNYYNNNILLMIMIVVISFLILLNDHISSKLYPLTIFVIAISLIYHITLISEYLNINDVLFEYKVADLVIKNSYWDWTIFGNYNSVLSITILAPILYHISGLSLTYVFKIIYPLLFSTTSIGVYFLFTNVINDKRISFMSSIFFIIIFPFFYQVPLICKQSTAEIFLILLLLSIFSNDLKSVSKSILVVIFTISLIVSHYGISYIMMYSLLFILVCMLGIKNKKVNIILDQIYMKGRNKKLNLNVKNNVSLNFVIFFCVFTIGWYMYNSSSSSFNTLIYMGKYILNSLQKEFATPENSRGLYLITKNEFSPAHYISKILYVLSQFFVVFGFLTTLWDYNKHKLNLIYIFFSLSFFTILFAAITVPYFSMMDPRRLYHLSLFLLAPFCIIGGSTIYKLICIFRNKCYNDKCLKNSYHFLSIFLSIFLLFNTGFIYEVTNEYPSSISLSQKSINSYNNIDIKANFYGSYIVTQDVFSGKWLDKNMIRSEKIYRGEEIMVHPSLYVYNNINVSNIVLFDNTTQDIGDGYIYVSYLNHLGIGTTGLTNLQTRTSYNFSDIHFLQHTDKIYDNGGSDILWKKDANPSVGLISKD